MTSLEQAVKALDEYAGPAAEEPPVGTIAVPRRLFVQLRRALKEVPV